MTEVKRKFIKRQTGNFKMDILIPPAPSGDNVKGKELFPMLECSIIIIGKPGSGKTMNTYNIVKTCGDKDTQTIVASKTFGMDKTWAAVTENLNGMGRVIIGDRTAGPMHEIMTELGDKAEADAIKLEEGKPSLSVKMAGGEEKKEKKPRKKKISACEYIFVCDDFASETRSKLMEEFARFFRHCHSKLIFASQGGKDVSPDQWGMADYILLHRGVSISRLKHIHECAMLEEFVSLDEFKSLYMNCIRQKHGFLKIEKETGTFKDGWNTTFDVHNPSNTKQMDMSGNGVPLIL